jgi:hypothetical protein
LELDEQPTSSSFVPREDEDDESTDSTEAVAEETAAVEVEVEA